MERLVTRMDWRVRRLAGVGALLIAWTTMAPAQSTPDVVFRQAAETETVKGDLKAAIAQYQRVVETAGANRALAAQALVRMAECYQKLGDTEARKVYERLVREFGDQTEVVQLAQRRLSDDVKPAAAMSLRRIPADPEITDEGAISADGRWITFPQWSTGNLAVFDRLSGNVRRLTDEGYVDRQYAEGSAISADSSQVAYAWFNGSDRYVLRLVSLRESAPGVPRTLVDSPDIDWIVPFGWTRNGRTIAVHLTRRDGTSQIALVSVTDGGIRILKSVEWQTPTRMFLSPDDRFLAFDLSVSEVDPRERDVFVLALDGSSEAVLVSAPGHDRIMGWSPDGARVLFASEQAGTLGLWAIPVRDGRPVGKAALLKPDTAGVSLGMTRDGALYTVARVGGLDIKTAEVDLAAGTLTAHAASAARRFFGTNGAPDWSPDGKYLAYRSRRDFDQYVIVVRTLATGEERELHVPLRYVTIPRWMPDSRSLITRGDDMRGRKGIYRIDAATGAASLLVADAADINGIPQVSPDGQRLYYWMGTRTAATQGAAFVERNLATQSVRAIIERTGPNSPTLSPDGTRLVGIVRDQAAKTSSLVAIAVDTGVRTEVARVESPRSFGEFPSWTPDGRSILLGLSSGAGRPMQMAIVAADGGPMRVIDLGVQGLQPAIRMHPDGRRIAFGQAGETRNDVWVLENFLR